MKVFLKDVYKGFDETQNTTILNEALETKFWKRSSENEARTTQIRKCYPKLWIEKRSTGSTKRGPRNAVHGTGSTKRGPRNGVLGETRSSEERGPLRNGVHGETRSTEKRGPRRNGVHREMGSTKKHVPRNNGVHEGVSDTSPSPLESLSSWPKSADASKHVFPPLDLD